MSDDYASAAMSADQRSKANARNVSALSDFVRQERARLDELIDAIRAVEAALVAQSQRLDVVESSLGRLRAESMGAGPSVR